MQFTKKKKNTNFLFFSKTEEARIKIFCFTIHFTETKRFQYILAEMENVS